MFLWIIILSFNFSDLSKFKLLTEVPDTPCNPLKILLTSHDLCEVTRMRNLRLASGRA